MTLREETEQILREAKAAGAPLIRWAEWPPPWDGPAPVAEATVVMTAEQQHRTCPPTVPTEPERLLAVWWRGPGGCGGRRGLMAVFSPN